MTPGEDRRIVRPMPRRWAVALGCAALCGCVEERKSACAGLKYTEAGLERREYAPCAAAMVRALDRAGDAVDVMGDKGKPEQERVRAKRDCLAATSVLARLLREAGGAKKLMANWDDRRLNEFNMAVLFARDHYLSTCYYGPKPFEQAGVPMPGRTGAHDTARAILAEIR